MRSVTCFIAALACVLDVCPTFGDEPTVDFDRQIRPLLSDNCFSCHGPDAAQRKGDLRLDIREAAVASGAIVRRPARRQFAAGTHRFDRSRQQVCHLRTATKS